MTASDFAAWVELMKGRDAKLSDVKLALLLGCSRNQIRFWQARDPGRTVGLACTALAQGWGEWRPDPNKPAP